MKHLLSAILLCVMSLTASAQFGPARQQQDLPGKPSLWNIRGKQYPRVLPDNRVVFRIQAPNAQQVQIDLGKRQKVFTTISYILTVCRWQTPTVSLSMDAA